MDDERRAVRIGEGVFTPNTLKEEFLAKRKERAEQSALLPPPRTDSPPAPSFDPEKRKKKLEEIAKRYEEGGKLDGSVFVATGPTVPKNTYGGGKLIEDPAWGFKPGETEFGPGHTAFTNVVLKQNDPAWAKTKYGSFQEHQEASKAVLSENASNGHALFRVTPDGIGHLGKHDPMLPDSALKERIDHGTILGIPSGAVTKKSSRFDSFSAFNTSESDARTKAATLTNPALVTPFNKTTPSLKVTNTYPSDIGTSIVKSGGTYTTSKVRESTVTLNSSESMSSVQGKISTGNAKSVNWGLAQHFPKN
jgi:hypothetical protein